MDLEHSLRKVHYWQISIISSLLVNLIWGNNINPISN
jgi:hypothetical protein